ncbi:MAG TPA: alpha-amylase/4-alpha-glucanotransferase domain-containing protein [Planctomycetaceae bacterium]
MTRVRLVLALHDHQPIGNFDGVFEDAFRDSYAPFLDVLRDYPDVTVSLHTSGSLLEWLVARKPEYIDALREFVARGQIEILGGPFYEPILASIPSRDRVGQIAAYGRYLENLFGQKVRGMWLPERVWEQQFTRDIAAAGIEFLILDDYHFRAGGLRGAELRNYYLTEDEGKMLALFPGDEHLRYLIPFQKPEKTIDYLRRVADERPGCVVTFGDDGEKFGTWPGTKESVYGKGWLRKFFDALVANKDWLTTTTLAEAYEHVAPMGKFYVPDCSYREMTEWALPTPRQTELHDLVHAHEHDPDWPQVKQYLRGGFWRNFRVKYPEANEMYCRMLGVSERLDELSRGEVAAEGRPLLAEARTHLYKAQCNCPYWHGAFGGLYLPHLRNAVYTHLIQADTLLDKAAGRTGRYAEADAADYDLDGRTEVRLTTDRLVAFLKPSRGGHLYELDVRGARHNLLATLDRRPEPYHETIRRHERKKAEAARAALHAEDTRAHHAGDSSHGSEEGAVSIHDLVHFKQPDLDKKLSYDPWPRKSLVDHFLMPGLARDEFRRGEGELGDFPCGVYETTLRRSEGRAEAVMSRTGYLTRFPIKVEKTVAVLSRNGGALEVTYSMSDLPANRPIHFAVELNFAGMAAGQPDRYFYDAGGRQLGQLQEQLDLPETDRLGLVDEWLGLDASVDLTEPAGIWTWPVETISQSEAGFEAVHQSTVVVPHWEFVAPEDGRWSVTLTLTLDTSAAQAKQLQEPATVTV